jgi:hypothetical protein
MIAHLTRSRNSNGSRPVVVHVSHFVRQFLQIVWFHTAIVNYDVMSWRNRTLVHMLRNQEEIPPVTASECMIDDGSRCRID